MAKYTGPSCRLCRREGEKLYLKGNKCRNLAQDGTAKTLCPFDKKDKKIIPPGPQRNGRKKTSDYSLQLREKQKTKRTYGLLEKQFVSYYKKAESMKGVTGENMLILIERRLDNVVFCMGIADSRAQARQLVCHGHICVNGKKVDIPSYLVKVNDEISVKTESADDKFFTALKQGSFRSGMPKWVSFDFVALKGQVLNMPTREDIDPRIKEHMIVELYSK